MANIQGRKLIDPVMCPIFTSSGVMLRIDDRGHGEFWLALSLTGRELADLYHSWERYRALHEVIDAPPGVNGDGV